MVFNDGLRTYEFYWPHELRGSGTVLDFPSAEAARYWLTGLQYHCAGFVVAIRALLDCYTPLACDGLADDEVFAEAAGLLQSHRLVVCFRERKIPQGSAPAAAEPPRAFVPFPLPKSRPPAAQAVKTTQHDPETFSPDIDFRSQAAVLVAAANSGAPFCPE